MASIVFVHAEDVAIKASSGLALHANLELADGKTMADGVVLLTHGTLAHNKMEIIVALQDALKQRGISSLAPTLSLGVSDRKGMYDCAVPSTHKHSDAFVEIGEWLNWAKEKGAANIVLAGHSRGGNQTAWFAAREPDAAVSKVVLIAPATYDAAKESRGFEKNHKRALKDAMAEAKALVDAGKGDTVLKGMGVLYCPGADVTAASFVSYYQVDERMHTPNLMGTIGKPTLVIAGTEDTVVEGLIDATKPLAEAGTVELVVIDGADHFFRDLFAEDVADAIEAFIAQ
ncbi:MAG: alpha/beta hydrolase [Rhodospirillales bacterium]|nr:alpha/beta hydrolase [Rhodospirillales bacterium]